MFSSGTHRRPRRLALVIGNSNYTHAGVLANPKRDAEAIAETLDDLGFDVAICLDGSQMAMLEALAAFKKKGINAEELVFYYCGHGLQAGGKNYLVPVDAEVIVRQDLDRLIHFDDVVDRLSECTGVKLFFLDACRSDPFERGSARVSRRSRELNIQEQEATAVVTQTGLAPVEVGLETLIAFSAAPGQVALDGSGEHSPYTEMMLMHLPTRGLEVEQLMARVGKSVQEATSTQEGAYRQVPWISTNLNRRTYFNPPTWRPILEIGLIGAVAGFATGPLAFRSDGCYVGLTGVGVLFGLVVAFGVWRWGRGTWWAAAVAALVTAISWWSASWILDAGILNPQSRDPETCEGIVPRFDELVALYAAAAAIVAILGTLAGAALTSKAFRKIPAWCTVVVAATMVAAVYAAAFYLITGDHALSSTSPQDSRWSAENLVRYSAAAIWYGILGGAIGGGFARHVPSGPHPE